MEQTDFWCVNINSGKLKAVLIIEHPSSGGSYKITVVCPSVQQLSIFLRNSSLVFLNFWHDGTMIIEIFKNVQSPLFQENLFLPKFGKKRPGMAQKYSILDFLDVSFSQK